VKASAAVGFLYLIIQQLSAETIIRNLLLQWHWGRFVTIAIAYFVAKGLFENGLARGKPLWQWLLLVFYGTTVLTLVVWAGYGTHIEDADPLLGVVGPFRILNLPTCSGRYLDAVCFLTF
jgi:hypothetical protein